MSNIYIKKYTPMSSDIWDTFIDTAKNPLFMHKRGYMDYHGDRFNDMSLMFYNEKNELIALLPADIKDGELRSHGGLTYGGLIMNSHIKQHTVIDCLTELKSYMADNDIHSLVYKHTPHMYHLQPSEEDIYALHRLNASLREVYVTTTLNLTNPVKLSRGRRAHLNRAVREGVYTLELTDRNWYERYMELENAVLMKYHDTVATHTADEMWLLHERFPENVRLIGGIYKDELIAGTIIYEYKTVVHTQYLAANETARVIGGLDLVVGSIIDRYRDSKLWLDFGISTEDNGRFLNEGLIAQKEGFGGRSNVLYTWELGV